MCLDLQLVLEKANKKISQVERSFKLLEAHLHSKDGAFVCLVRMC